MKSLAFVIFFFLIATKFGYAQTATLFVKQNGAHIKGLTAVDSLNERSGVSYPVSFSSGADYMLSVDQNEMNFLSGPLYNSARDNYLQVPVKLTNNTADTLKYFNMSCSWWDIYRTDNQNLKIFAPGLCWKNSPVICSVPPHQQVLRYIVILIPKEMKISVIFKVGMLLEKISTNYRLNKVNYLTELATSKQLVIWSNYIGVSQWHANSIVANKGYAIITQGNVLPGK